MLMATCIRIELSHNLTIFPMLNRLALYSLRLDSTVLENRTGMQMPVNSDYRAYQAVIYYG